MNMKLFYLLATLFFAISIINVALFLSQARDTYNGFKQLSLDHCRLLVKHFNYKVLGLVVNSSDTVQVENQALLTARNIQNDVKGQFNKSINMIRGHLGATTGTSVSKNMFPDSKYFLKPWNKVDRRCHALFGGKNVSNIKAHPIIIPGLRNSKIDCQKLLTQGHFIMSSLTREEEEFPIAYSILVFTGQHQFYRLLRAIYRPQNVYCVHIDALALKRISNAIKQILSCFDNVFISSRSVIVNWGTFSVLEAEIICMQDLLKYRKWKYFINLTGQEFPLRTNYELVKVLKAYNGSNDIEGTLKRANKDRWEGAGKPPHNITAVKGSVHIAANRKFIEYAIYNETGKQLINWSRNVSIPDESFFSTLNHNPHLGIPGTYKGYPETDKIKKPYLARFKNWRTDPLHSWPCHGVFFRDICVFGVGDLSLLSKRRELFANKFYDNFMPLTLNCMEEIIFNRTRDEYFQNMDFNTTYYSSLDFVTNKV